MNIIELAKQVGLQTDKAGVWVDDGYIHDQLEKFAALVDAAARADERESIVQMFESAPALVQFAQNDHGGCLVCGFTPKLVIEAIRARGTT